MGFRHTFENLIFAFEEEGLTYAVIGGIALESVGVIRATMDIDFLLLASQADTARTLMRSKKFEIIHESADVINCVGMAPSSARVDFILAHRKYTLAMLQRARRRSILQGRAEMPVAAPEDLIGLKVQAMANDPHRRNQDMADIQAIFQKRKRRLEDWTWT